ncbi:MAG: hypothetical protein GY742_06705 [Hyphomicrobiales bacterium]|nr:hypothetical protein [Hyphomicrobiales bacterium]
MRHAKRITVSGILESVAVASGTSGYQAKSCHATEKQHRQRLHMLRQVQGLYGGKAFLCSKDGMWFDIVITIALTELLWSGFRDENTSQF